MTTATITAPAAATRLEVRYPLLYTWEYAHARPELRTLYEKSKGLMWNAGTDLAWDTRVDPEAENVPDAMNPLFGSAVWARLDAKREIPNLRRHMGSYLISNFLHGEQGALLATSQIVNAAPTAASTASRARSSRRRRS
jgi:hypothetical protein